jgi:hypothetical protein
MHTVYSADYFASSISYTRKMFMKLTNDPPCLAVKGFLNQTVAITLSPLPVQKNRVNIKGRQMVFLKRVMGILSIGNDHLKKQQNVTSTSPNVFNFIGS